MGKHNDASLARGLMLENHLHRDNYALPPQLRVGTSISELQVQQQELPAAASTMQNHLAMTLRNDSVGMLSTSALSATSRVNLQIASMALTRACAAETSPNNNAGAATQEHSIARNTAADQRNLQQEMPSAKCEKTFSLLLRNWERLNLDKCYKKGTPEQAARIKWCKTRGLAVAISKKKQIVIDIIDVERRRDRRKLSRQEFALELDELMQCHGETVTSMWHHWRKHGKWRWEM